MSKKPETLFSNQLIKNLNQVFFTRIEIISPLQISWNYKHFQKNPINYYLVKDPRRDVIELYDGNKGRELLENADSVGASLSFDRENWHLLTTYLFS